MVSWRNPSSRHADWDLDTYVHAVLEALAEVFAWLRPDDLIWNYWVNNYLLGKTPPVFDILHWNADTTRMTAGLHRDSHRLAMANKLVRPGDATALGVPVDLGKVA